MDHAAPLRGRRAAVRARLRAAGLGLLLAVAVQAPSAAAVPVTGDQAAWREIGAAFRKLQATTYRMTMTAPGQTVLVEHVPPDSRRTITTITGHVGEIESVTVGREARFRVIGSGASARWICGDEGPQPPVALTMEGLGMAVEVARRPDSVIVGARVRTYLLTYTFREKRPGHRTTLYVERKTGLPRRSVTPYTLGAGEVVSNYYDYGAPIGITLPPCG
ncbi:MAG TPA: hypothetical protein VKW09_13095 [bacterium]|nr:hypothetical protein [bacterium]